MKRANGISILILVIMTFTCLIAQTSPSKVAVTDESRAINWNNGSSIARASNGALMAVYGTLTTDTLVYAVTYDSDFQTWNTPMAVGKGSAYSDKIQSHAKVAADANNAFHVVWSDNYKLFHSKYDGSAWSTAVQIPNTSSPWDTLSCAKNAVAIGSDGAIWVVWSTDYEGDGINEWYYASQSTNDGVSWSTPDTLFTDVLAGDVPSSYSLPYLATGPNGKVGVTLRGPKMGPKSRYTGIFQEYDGTSWGATEVICDFYASATTGDSVDVYQVSLAYDGDGNRHFAFYTDENDFSADSLGQIFYTQKSAAGTWSTPIRTTAFPDGSSDYPAIAVGDNNSLYTVFFAKDPAGIRHIYAVTSANLGTTWSDTIRLSNNTTGLDARGPSIAKFVGTAGADVLWIEPDATDGYGIYYGNIPFVEYVAVDDVDLPTTYKLLKNYPNPFNPTTTILFGVNVKSNVNLTVYNALGQEITRLVDRQMEVGVYEVKFNASDLASGIYFYRLTSGDSQITKKLLYLK